MTKLSKFMIVEEYNMMNSHSLSIIRYMYNYLYKGKRNSDVIEHDTIIDLIKKNIIAAKLSNAISYPFKRYVIEESKDKGC